MLQLSEVINNCFFLLSFPLQSQVAHMTTISHSLQCIRLMLPNGIMLVITSGKMATVSHYFQWGWSHKLPSYYSVSKLTDVWPKQLKSLSNDQHLDTCVNYGIAHNEQIILVFERAGLSVHTGRKYPLQEVLELKTKKTAETEIPSCIRQD